VEAFSKEECAYLIQEIEAFEAPRWFHRDKINSIPTKGSNITDYYFCGDRQQPKAFNEYLRSLAPKIKGTWLGEAVINRYDVGGHMPEHIDHAQYRFNMVIPLCDNGDGLYCGETFHEDDAGNGVIFPARSEPHSVPPVKHRRYVVIFLYE